jgi:uncharacterized protein YoxC
VTDFSHVDLGQLIIAVLIAVIGYFVKTTLEKFSARLDQHDSILFSICVAIGIDPSNSVHLHKRKDE